MTVAKPICERYNSSELISAEYDRRMLDHRIIPRRCIGKSIFYAEPVSGQNINIYKCYPINDQCSYVSFPTSRIHPGWAFHNGHCYRMGGFYSADGGRTSAEVLSRQFHILIQLFISISFAYLKVECIGMDKKLHTRLPRMFNARASFKSIVFGEHIYVFGGRMKQKSISDCERYVVIGD